MVNSRRSANGTNDYRRSEALARFRNRAILWLAICICRGRAPDRCRHLPLPGVPRKGAADERVAGSSYGSPWRARAKTQGLPPWRLFRWRGSAQTPLSDRLEFLDRAVVLLVAKQSIGPNTRDHFRYANRGRASLAHHSAHRISAIACAERRGHSQPKLAKAHLASTAVARN